MDPAGHQPATPEPSAGRFAGLTRRLRGARAWSAARPRLSLLLAVATAMLLGVVISGWIYLLASSRADPSVTLQMAYDALDAGAYVEAGLLAKRLRARKPDYDDLAGLAFVQGAALAHATGETWTKDKTPWYRLAARHLEEARDHGFPDGREAEGLWLLGRCLYLSRQYPASRVALLAALPLNPNRASAIHRMLAEACQRDANPKLKEALKHNAAYLADRMLSQKARYAGELERARILFRLGRIDQCARTLDQIPADAPVAGEVILTRGRIQLEKARAIKNDAELMASGENLKRAIPQYQRAIELFRQAQAHDTLASDTTREAMYLIGVCHAETGNLTPAYEQLERTSKLYYDTPEGLAASLAAADALRLLKRRDEAASAYARAFAAAGAPEHYSNPWLSLDEFRLRMLAAHQAYLDGGRYEYALRLLQGFQPLFSESRATELLAQTHRAWADALTRQALDLPVGDAGKIEEAARAQFRKAGIAYARLARLRIVTREYPEDLWNSADNLLRGHDYVRAARVLKEYLKNETRRRRPLALVGLGRAKLALGDFKGAVRDLTDCVESHPRDAAVYEARLLCAHAYRQLGEMEKAEQLLRVNIAGGTLTPASREWRESLFALGELLHIVGRHKEAIRYLEEAVARYPDSDRTMEGYYLIGQSYREAAKAPQARLREATAESARIEQRREMEELLRRALENYTRAREQLSRRAADNDLTELDAAILRNCYFFIGAVLYDLGRYEEAIKVYSNASTRYQNEPAALEALVQVAACHRRLHQPDKARGALAQAKLIWKRLPKDADFLATTNYPRDQWPKLLDQLSAW